jgi:hypothetical protein
MPSRDTWIKPTSKFTKLNFETLKIQPKCKFLLKCMRKIKKNKNGCFKYGNLVNFMIKNKDNPLYYTGRGITSVKNVSNYWNYAHSHSTAYIPDFNKMYNLNPVKQKRNKIVNSVVKNYYINFN